MKNKRKYHIITRQIIFSYITMAFVFILNPILIFILTRNLSVSEYGVYSLFSVTRMILVVVLELGLSQYIVTKLTGTAHKKKIKSFSSLLLFGCIFAAIVLGILMIPQLNSPILSILKISSYALEFRLLLALIFIGVIIRLFSFYVIAQRRLELQSIINFLQECLWIIILVACMFFIKKLNLLDVVSIWIIGFVLTLLFCIIYLRRDVSRMVKVAKTDGKIIKEGLSFGIPLVPAVMGSWILSVGDRYILTYFTDTATVGMYSLAYSISVLILSFATVITNIFYPYIAEAWNKKKDHNLFFNMSLKYGLMIIAPCTLGMFVLRNAIITAVSGVKYIGAVPIFAILVFHPIFPFIVLILRQHLLLRLKTRVISYIYIFGAVLNIALDIVLIPKIGMYGAAIAILTSYFLMFLAAIAICRKYIKLNHSYLKIARIVTASVIMAVVLYFINPTTILMDVVAVVAGFLVYVLFLFTLGAFVKEEIALIKNLRIRKFFK